MTEDLAVREPTVSLFDSDEPGLLVQHATRIADELTQVITKRGLSVTISGRQHVRVEGWTMLGDMLGVFASVVWTRPVADSEGKPYGWEARVEARTKAGELVGAAQAICLRTEQQWRNRDDYALYSMAQTRATSKALRQPLGFVISLAGFEATPAEEMSLAPKQVVRDKTLPPPSPPPPPVRERLTADVLNPPVDVEAEEIPFGEPNEREQMTVKLLLLARDLPSRTRAGENSHDEMAERVRRHRAATSDQEHLGWLRRTIQLAEERLQELELQAHE